MTMTTESIGAARPADARVPPTREPRDAPIDTTTDRPRLARAREIRAHTARLVERPVPSTSPAATVPEIPPMIRLGAARISMYGKSTPPSRALAMSPAPRRATSPLAAVWNGMEQLARTIAAQREKQTEIFARLKALELEVQSLRERQDLDARLARLEATAERAGGGSRS